MKKITLEDLDVFKTIYKNFSNTTIKQVPGSFVEGIKVITPVFQGDMAVEYRPGHIFSLLFTSANNYYICSVSFGLDNVETTTEILKTIYAKCLREVIKEYNNLLTRQITLKLTLKKQRMRQYFEEYNVISEYFRMLNFE